MHSLSPSTKPRLSAEIPRIAQLENPCAHLFMAETTRPTWNGTYPVVLECQSRKVAGGFKHILPTCEWAVAYLKLKTKPCF